MKILHIVDKKIVLPALILLLWMSFTGAQAETKLIMLGTGTPVPNAERAGQGIAIIYNGKAYLFDVGGGVVKRCIQAWKQMGFKSLNPTKISHLFITHLHSDHVLDYPEFANTYWWRRTSQINVYGPVGIEKMAWGYYQMIRFSIRHRIEGKQPVKNPTFYQTIQHEYKKGGWTFNKNGIKIEAFEVAHGDLHPAFGYKIQTPDKTIVISGDTMKSEKVIEMATGADILVHEVISEDGISRISPFWQKYHSSYHTRTPELAEIANKAKPKLLILTHVLHYTAPVESALHEIKKLYKGKVVLANDLDVF